jgi:hypothetical protein
MTDTTKSLLLMVVIGIIVVAIIFAATGFAPQKKFCSSACYGCDVKEKTSVVTTEHTILTGGSIIDSDGIKYHYGFDWYYGFEGSLSDFNRHNITFQYYCNHDGNLQILQITEDHTASCHCGVC